MSSYSLPISSQSQSPSCADMREPHPITQDNPVPTSSKDRDFSLDCPEYRWLLEPLVPVLTSDSLPTLTEQPLVSASFSSAPTSSSYVAHNQPEEWLAQGYEGALHQGHMPHPSPSTTSFAHQQAVHSPSIPINDDPRQPASCRSTTSSTSALTPAPKIYRSQDQFIDPAQLVISRPIPVSIPPAILHRQCPQPAAAASHGPGLQNGESGVLQTLMFNGPTTGFVISSETRNLVELNEDHGAEYSRSQPAGGLLDLSQVNVSLAENTATTEDQIVDDQEPPLAPSPPTTLTSTSASEGSRSLLEILSSPPTSPEPLTPSPPIRPPSAASSSSAGLSSTSSTSSSSSHESPKRKRENDEPSSSSSAPAKKSKKAEGPSMKQGTRRPPAVLVLRHVPVDPSIPKPEDEFREYTPQARIQPW